MTSTKQKHFRVDKVFYLPLPCKDCKGEEIIAGRRRLYSLEIIRAAPLILLFGLLADDLNDLCFTEHQIVKLVDENRKWFSWGMRTHLFLGNKREVFSVRLGEDGVFHFEEHDLLCLSEVWPGDRGHHLYVPDYLIG